MISLPPPVPRNDDAAELRHRHAAPDAVAWVLVFTGGVLLGLSGLYWLSRGSYFDNTVYETLGGMPWLGVDAFLPGIARLVSLAVRLYGLAVLCLSLLVIGISFTSYRSSERWAWYAVWVVPFYAALTLAVLGAYNVLSAASVAWYVTLLGIALLGLVVPYKRFFPEEAAGRIEGAGVET